MARSKATARQVVEALEGQATGYDEQQYPVYWNPTKKEMRDLLRIGKLGNPTPAIRFTAITKSRGIVVTTDAVLHEHMRRVVGLPMRSWWDNNQGYDGTFDGVARWLGVSWIVEGSDFFEEKVCMSGQREFVQQDWGWLKQKFNIDMADYI